MDAGGPRPFSVRPAEYLVFDGQSLNIQPAAGITYPVALTQRLTPGPFTVVGLGGTTYAQRATTAATRVDPLHQMAARSVWIDQGGQSDILADMTAAQVVAGMESYANARRAAGFSVLVGSTLPDMVTGSVTVTPAQHAVLQQVNALVRISSVFDAIADLAADPRLADASNTTFFSDGLHPTTAGAAAMADVFEAAFATVGIT